MEKKFKVGDVVYTDTHGVDQNTQKSLSRLKGIIVDNDDYPYNIHVHLENFSKYGNYGFSEFELSHEPIIEYKNERI